MKKAMMASMLLLTLPTLAQLPAMPQDVEVYKESQQPQFENIPLLKKVYKGAKNTEERKVIEQKCRQWVIAEIQKAEAPYFKTWCSLKTDIVLREYSYTAYLLIKNW